LSAKESIHRSSSPNRAGQRFFYVSGKSEASSALLDMRLQRMMGHFPALLHSSLIPCLSSDSEPRYGAIFRHLSGSTENHRVRTRADDSSASNKYFGNENYRVLDDPRTRNRL
jgi:hypothetical protein